MANFGNLVPSSELRTELEQLATIVVKPKGAILFNHGDNVSGVFLIRSGKVKLCLDCEKEVYPSRFLGPGAIAGLPATVSGSPYSLTATVVEDSELAFVTRNSVLSCLKDNVVLCFQVMGMLSGEICNARSVFKKSSLRRHTGVFNRSTQKKDRELASIKND